MPQAKLHRDHVNEFKHILHFNSISIRKPIPLNIPIPKVPILSPHTFSILNSHSQSQSQFNSLDAHALQVLTRKNKNFDLIVGSVSFSSMRLFYSCWPTFGSKSSELYDIVLVLVLVLILPLPSPVSLYPPSYSSGVVVVQGWHFCFQCAQIESEFCCSAAPKRKTPLPTYSPIADDQCPLPLVQQQQLQTTQQCRKANKN